MNKVQFKNKDGLFSFGYIIERHISGEVMIDCCDGYIIIKKVEDVFLVNPKKMVDLNITEIELILNNLKHVYNSMHLDDNKERLNVIKKLEDYL